MGRRLKESETMEKGKGVTGGRRWAVDFIEYSTTPSRDIPDPPGFSHTSVYQVPSSAHYFCNICLLILIVNFVQDDSTLSWQC